MGNEKWPRAPPVASFFFFLFVFFHGKPAADGLLELPQRSCLKASAMSSRAWWSVPHTFSARAGAPWQDRTTVGQVRAMATSDVAPTTTRMVSSVSAEHASAESSTLALAIAAGRRGTAAAASTCAGTTAETPGVTNRLAPEKA
eukprot:RCo045498